MMRVSIRFVTGLVAFIALSLGCLLYAASPWAVTVRLIYWAVLFGAPLGVVYRTKSRQAFYVGVLIWSWGYLLVSLLPGTWNLPTSRFLAWAYPTLIPEKRQPAQPIEGAYGLVVSPSPDNPGFEDLGEFVDIRDKADRSLVVERIHVNQKGVESITPDPDRPPVNPGDVRIWLDLDTDNLEKLSRIRLENRSFVVLPHRESIVAQFAATPPVDRASFDEVGHAFFGILFAFAGGLSGTWFHQTRGEVA
jgi:hypothetical protein